MSADPNKKSGRTFQCRDVLWDTFEQMARELECSVDYLINEAMKQYARQRSYGGASRTPFPGQRGESVAPPAGPTAQMGPAQPSIAPGMATPLVPPPPAIRASTLSPPGIPQRMPPPPAMRSSVLGGGLPAPPASRGGQPVPVPPPPRGYSSPRSMSSMPQVRPPAAPRSIPPPIPRGLPQPSGPVIANGSANLPIPGGSTGTLSVIYQGEKLPVTKDRFVIGRGKQSSDLTLKDPNVSRQHAMVEFQNGVYFMVDMGSTNGVEYNGQRVARKQITEGDIFKICDHEMRFTYH
jgi:pSer/pThr/pTyr-binding forkhead associated (FHA) protein